MEKKATKRSEYVKSLLEHCKIPRNQLATASGLTNTYIRDLEQDNINNVARDKLIYFAVALNLNLNRIDELLTIFDRAKLSEADVDTFIRTSARRRSSSALFPLRDFYAYELVGYAMELIPGDQVLVSDRPTVCLREEGHRTFTDDRLVKAHPVYSNLVETIGRHRRMQFEKNLARFRIVHYICKECLEDYLLNCPYEEEKQWRRRHVENFLDTYRNYPNLELHLTGVCSNMLFSIKESTDDRDINFNYCARPGHYVPGERPGRLAGFASSNTVTLQIFREELSSIKSWVLEEYRDRARMENYLTGLLAR